MDRLKRQLDDINVTYTEKIFETENGIAELGTEPFVSHQTLIIQYYNHEMWSHHLTHRIPASEYTSLQPMLCMQDLYCAR